MLLWFKYMPRRVWIISLITLVVVLIFAFDVTPWVRGGYGWRWDYLPVAIGQTIPLIVSLIIYVIGAWLILTRTHQARYALLWGLLGTVGLSLAVAYVREGDVLYMLFTRTVSLPSSSEWWAGATINWSGGEWLDWTGVMTRYGVITSNIGTSPPGIPMLYALVTDLIGKSPNLTESLFRGLLPLQCHSYDLLKFTPAEWGSAWLGMLTPVWAGLAVFPIFSIARRLAPEADGRIPVLWWALVPGMLSFTTSSSTFFP
ncbi:MAG TPA: hypothetical protein VHL11_12490, partial [Phototrophicaceae bacterium]|nr:hypothetical protein [Phototrophicaceae bacterium]